MPRSIPIHLVVFVEIVCVLGTAAGPTRVMAQDQPAPCPAYVIEGSISPPVAGGSSSERMASVYVHTSGEPLADRQVVATFSDASGSAIGEPMVLVTNAGGRAEVQVPQTAESVNFIAETPDTPSCLGEGDDDPRVLLEILPIEVPAAEVPDGVPVPDGGQDLAETGPVTDVIALASLLLLAFGAAVGTGRGRRRALSTPSHGVKPGIRR